MKARKSLNECQLIIMNLEEVIDVHMCSKVIKKHPDSIHTSQRCLFDVSITSAKTEFLEFFTHLQSVYKMFPICQIDV